MSFGIPQPSDRNSSHKLAPMVKKLRKAIGKGALEKRNDLVEGLNFLAIAYVQEARFQEALDTIDEAMELAATLREEGQREAEEELGMCMISLSAALRTAEAQHSKSFDRKAFYSRFDKCYELLSEERAKEAQPFWAKEVYEQLKDLYEQNKAGNPIITRLTRQIELLAPDFDPTSDRVIDWNNRMEPYHLRSICKYELGDRNGAIEDMLKYEEIFTEMENVLSNRKPKTITEMRDDGNIVLRVDTEDILDMMGKVNHSNDHFDAMSRLAHMFAEKADKEKALEYYDKALASANKERGDWYESLTHFGIFSAKADIPFRKGHLYALYHEYDKALELFDEAIKATESLLETDKERYLDMMQARFSEYWRARSQVLTGLGRFDEATQSVDQANEYFARIRKEAVERFRQRAEEAKKKKQKDKNDQDENGPNAMDILNSIGLPGGPKVKVIDGRGMSPKTGKPGGPSILGRGDSNDVPIPKVVTRGEVEDGYDDLSSQEKLDHVLKGDQERMEKLAKMSPEEKRARYGSGDEITKEEMQDFLLHLQAKHNEAAMDLQRAQIEMQRDRYRTALMYLLKARIVMDFSLIQSEMPETRQNAFGVYMYISICYMRLGLYKDAEKWFKHTERILLSLINDQGRLNYRKEHAVILMHSGMVQAHQCQWDKAIDFYKRSINLCDILIDERLEDIAGCDPEILLIRDNQRVMTVVELLDCQIRTYKSLVLAQFHANRLEDALASAHKTTKYTDEMARLLTADHHVTKSFTYYAVSTIIILLLMLGKDEEVEVWKKKGTKYFLELSRVKWPEDLSPEAVQKIYDDYIENKLFDMVFDDENLTQLQYDYSEVWKLAAEGKIDEALEILEDIREEMNSHPFLGADTYPMIVQLRGHLMKFLDKATETIRNFNADTYAQSKRVERQLIEDMVNADIVDVLYHRFKEEREVDETDTEDYTIYEREIKEGGHDFELFFQISDELVGTRLGSDDPKEAALKFKRIQAMFEGKTAEPVRSKPRVGRNEPCPCGSGKKFKKCCGKA